MVKNEKKSMPLISVIVPVYNTEKYLPKCLDSIIAQTFTDIEIICVDDGSTDNSAEILKQYRAKDKRLKIITQKNNGLSAARNAALEKAKGKYVSFIDSDDFVADSFLKKLFTALNESKCRISGCDFQKIKDEGGYIKNHNETGKKVYDNALEVLLNRHNFIHFNVWNKLYTREIIGDIRFIEGVYFEDWIFNCCVFSKAEKFCWIDDKLYGYRLSENSIMRSPFSYKKINDYAIGIKAVYKYFSDNLPDKWQKVRRTRISRTVKMLMNASRRSHDENIIRETADTLKELYAANLIGFEGLSLINKIKLLHFLHYKK